MTGITDADLLAWQRRAALCLGELLKLGARKHLPVLTWRIGTGPEVTGEPHPGPAARADLEAWKAAIAGVACRPPDSETRHGGIAGDTRAVVRWEWLPVKLAPAEGHPVGVHVVLAAYIPAEEDIDA